MPNEIKPVIVADDGINRSIKPVIIADDGINKVKKKEVSQSTQNGGTISSEASKTEKQKRSDSLSSVNRWANVTEPKAVPSKYRTDDYIDIIENKPLKKKKVISVVADEYVPNVKVTEIDAPTEKEAETMMNEDFGKKEFDAYQNINKINKDIVFKSEDEAVDELRKKFKGSGFIFETTGIGNKIKVSTSTNGGLSTINSMEFDLVRPSMTEETTGLVAALGNRDKQGEERYNQLVDFMSKSILKKTDKDFLKKDVKDYGQLVNLMADNPYKYGEEFLNQYDTDRWFDNQYRELVIESKSLKRDEEELLKQYDQVINNSTGPEQEAELKNKINSLDERKNILKSKYNDIGKLNEKLKVSSAVYYKNKEKQGNTLGLISKSFMKGAFNMEKALAGTAADIMPYVLPEGSLMPDVQREQLKASGMSDTEIKDYASKQLRKQIIPEIEKGLSDLVSFGTTDEYIQSKDRNDLEKVASFLSESIGTAASAGGNPALQKIAFFTQSYNGIEDEMNSSQFDGLSQFEKKLIAVPYGLTIGALENLGFKFTTGATKNPLFNKLVNNIVFRTFSNLPKDASATLMQSELKRNSLAMITNAGLKIVGGALVEGGVEGLQQLDEIAIKNISNAITDKDYFQNVPDITTAKGINQAIGAAATDAYYGVLGGLIMSAGSESVSAIREGYSNRKSDDDFAIFSNSLKDNNLRSSVESDIKSKIVSGDITKEEAKAQVESMNKSYSILQSIPNNLNIRDQRESFNLILEKQKIQKETQGKDPALVTAQTDRINEINDELKNISKNAVQVETTGEVPLQPEARVGEEMVQGESKTEPQGVTEEGQAVQEVESLRAKEQDEIKAKLPNAEYKADGKIDVDKLSDKDKKIYDKIYANYDKLISPLLAPEVTLPTDEIGRPVGSQKYKAGVNQKKGRTITRTAPDGTKIKGSFKVVPASELIPSHNPNTFGKNEAFPQNKEGRTINDRDYETDKPAQSQVIDIAQNIDERAVTQTPVVSKEGIVYDGNNRTMSRQLAAQNKTDDEYIQALINQADMYGITEEDINAIENPTLVFEVEENLPFDTKTMAMFNKQEKKAQGPLQRAVAISKRISDRAKRQLANLYEAVEIPSDVTSDPKNMKQAIDILIQEGLVQTVEIPRFIDKGVATPDGVSFLEGVVMAASLNEDSIRELSVPGMGDIKKVILKNIVGLMQNAAKGEDSLAKEIAGAIQIIQKAKAAKISVDDYLSQYDMFKENQYTIGEMSMALLLDTKKPLVFKNFLTNYNENVGVENIFGEDTSKEAILNNTISELINDYGKIKENLESIAKERGEQVVESIEEAGPAETIEEVKDLDVTDKTNLQKVKSFLDKLEDDLDKFGKETLGVNLPVAAMKLIIKALKVSVQAGMTLEQAIKDYAQKNNVDEKRINDSLYSMSDFQARKTRERITGEKQPKVKISKEATEAKDISKRKVTKVIIKDEYKAMITQIKLEVKAAREAKLDLNAKRKMLASAISNMVRTGKIKASQAAVLVKRVSSINLDNPVMVERFTNYAQRVFERADYQQTLDNAFSIRKSIRKLLKSDNQAEVVGMAKAFTKIDPSLVDDIDAYIEMADKVKNAVKPSRTKGEEVVLKQAANIAEISEYSKNEIARQEQIKIDELLAVYDYLENISEDMSFKELQSIVDLLKEDPEAQVDKEVRVKEFLKNRFDFMAGIIETMFKTGIDPMTGEEVTFDEKQKDLMKRVLDIDLNEMSTREAIKIVESVDNFLNNQITSGLEAAVSSYEGAINDKQLVEKGFKAKSLRLLFSNYIGKIYSEQLFSLPMLMERMFGGVTNSIDIMNKMGLGKLINGVNRANRQHNDIIDQYSKQPFYDSKEFMDAENVYERGMLAFLKRNLVGSPTEMKAEFERRVRMVQESINKLTEDGDPKEQKMGELYQKIYDKLGVAEMDMDIINANASKNNLDAIDWWINQWSKNYSDLSDISLSVYNTQLGSDLNYTPDKYKKLSSENQSLDEGAVERNGAFAISIDYTDKNKTGVLMETTRPNVMPDGRYISLDFDNNNSKALKSALTDINTASSIRQIDGFINSKSFKKLIPESEDRSILTKRINTYIRRSKGKNIVPSDTIQYLNKLVNFATALGVGKALGGISQAVSQTIPVMVNTVVNAGRFDFAGADFNAWLNKTGLAISNRGLESQSTVESIDRKLDTKGTGTQEAMKKVTDLNQWYLKQFLVRPDVFIARSSFKSYYLQNLKRRGISTDIDWTTHEMDMDAANYAQAMIDRQQNISDSMLAGEFLASDDPIKQIVRKVVLPFASFILNQKARMYNDLNTVFSKTSSSEDRIIASRSLTGLAAELATYQLIGFGIRRLYDSIAAALLGDEDDEEAKKKKMINATKYPIKNIVNDIISPIPMTDGLVTWGLNQSLAQYPWMDDKEIKDAVNSRNKVLELKGEDPMDDKAKAEFIAKIKEEAVYQVFEDDFDRSYGMIGIVGSTYQELGEMGKLATTGEFTDEYQGRETTKLLLESDRKKVAYAVPFMIAYSTGLLPKDIGSISRNYVNRIKKKAITEKQYERFEGVKKDLGRNLESWEIQLVKDKKESETAISEIEFIERNGGLTERQGREYLKLMKAIGEPTVSDLTKIKNGQTADQILK